MTLAERLLAGEHHGCASWAEVARKLQCDERRLRVVRKTLAANGALVGLVPVREESKQKVDVLPGLLPGREDIQKPDKPARSQFANSESPTVAGGSVHEYRKTDTHSDHSIKRWPSVEEFDREIDVVPSHHTIKGVSSFVVDGEVRGQWIKTTAVNDDRTAWMDAVRSLADALPRIEPVATPAHADEDLLVVLPVGDPHVGLLSWHEDAGENFDLEIAERNLLAAFQNLIARAPAAARFLLVFIGDNTHADGQNNTTTKGTRVDVDGRTVKMARTNLNIIRQAIALCLAKFGSGTVIIERGNHDELLAAMTALALGMFYENEPRVTVDQSPEMYHWMRFGQNLIGTHHGDKAKPEQLLGVMAVDRAQDWGETTHRRFYCGHYHHQIVKELPGLIVEYLPTLASSDAWHRAMGYRSARAMYMDVFHREWGHVDRCIVGIRQLRAP